MRPDQVTPTGVANAALLDLEFAEPPAEPPAEPVVTAPIPPVDPPTVELHPIGRTVGWGQPEGPNGLTEEPGTSVERAADEGNGSRLGEAAGTTLPGCAGEHLLQQTYGTSERAERFYRDQVLDHLNPEMIEFVGRMEMAFVGTADAGGECDSTFRAGPPGFLRVLDPQRIAYPEYRGNGVLASLGNISENPHVAVLMIDFVRDLIGLHVNGRASIIDDAELRAEHPSLPLVDERGRTPERWVVVHVEEAYVHCRKHIPRMQPVPRERDWGTDDMKRKGGDYFNVRARQIAGHH